MTRADIRPKAESYVRRYDSVTCITWSQAAYPSHWVNGAISFFIVNWTPLWYLLRPVSSHKSHFIEKFHIRLDNTIITMRILYTAVPVIYDNFRYIDYRNITRGCITILRLMKDGGYERRPKTRHRTSWYRCSAAAVSCRIGSTSWFSK